MYSDFDLDKHRSDHDRVEKARDRERRSPSDDDRSRSPTPTKSKDSAREGTEHMSLSMEETNKLRAQLGLRPLDAPSSATGSDEAAAKSGNSDENFVHKPAEDLSEKRRLEKTREKLETFKEKRSLQDKFL